MGSSTAGRAPSKHPRGLMSSRSKHPVIQFGGIRPLCSESPPPFSVLPSASSADRNEIGVWQGPTEPDRPRRRGVTLGQAPYSKPHAHLATCVCVSHLVSKQRGKAATRARTPPPGPILSKHTHTHTDNKVLVQDPRSDKDPRCESVARRPETRHKYSPRRRVLYLETGGRRAAPAGRC